MGTNVLNGRIVGGVLTFDLGLGLGLGGSYCFYLFSDTRLVMALGKLSLRGLRIASACTTATIIGDGYL